MPYLIAFYTYLAINEDGVAAAWISMRADGYIDMLFCLPEALGCGAAGQLYETVERIATELSLSQMTAHASLLAEPFFAKRGWKVEKREVQERNGVGIPRAEMSKGLGLQTN
jgi:putative acetyltransferase